MAVARMWCAVVSKSMGYRFGNTDGERGSGKIGAESGRRDGYSA